MDDGESVARVSLPPGASGVWRSATWVSPEAGALEGATLEVDPPTAFRALRVRRANGELLANESWDRSRTRGLRIWPADRRLAAGEAVTVEAVAWWPDSVALTARMTMTWRKDGA